MRGTKSVDEHPSYTYLDFPSNGGTKELFSPFSVFVFLENGFVLSKLKVSKFWVWGEGRKREKKRERLLFSFERLNKGWMERFFENLYKSLNLLDVMGSNRELSKGR